MEEENIRQVIYSEEFNDFYDSLDSRIQDKFDYGLRLIKTQYVVNKKFVKHLENTDFYELRISISSDEYRISLMLKFNEEKLAKLRTFDDVLQEKYGEPGSAARKEFDARAKAWYYAELLKDERKKQKMTQKVLAEKIGKKREYVSSLEKGQTDMQLSTFLRIADALGLQFSLVVG